MAVKDSERLLALIKDRLTLGQKLKLGAAWFLVKGEIPEMAKALGNLRTTLASFAFALLIYFQANGNAIPTTKDGWTAALIAAGLTVLGALSKDGATGSSPGAKS